MRSEWREIEEQRRQAEGNALRFVAIGTLVAAAFLLGAHYFGRQKPVPVQDVEPEIASLIPQSSPEPRETPEPREPMVRGPAAVSPAQSHVGIYECLENGQRVVSDRPCSGGATARTLVIDQPESVGAARQRLRTQGAGQVTAGAPRSAVVGGVTYCIHVRSRVTSEEKVHTCRSFDSFQNCQVAADRIDGRCGSPRQ